MMITEYLRNNTVREMLDCPATSLAFWSQEFMIIPDEDLTFVENDENVLIKMNEIEVVVPYNMTLEDLEQMFGDALSEHVRKIKERV
ncbi:hypothetical protein PVA8_275 [Vibrio phage PVA8]|nr:hypothetical protein [Vibrio phage PC-Liy1]URQ03261.1 hypothetical protein PVA8_275 [Vibrio phage PVA8]WBM58996.1 hypothetical protein vBValMPVA8_274 [Vibrio phage vB_ValM_PVA8]